MNSLTHPATRSADKVNHLDLRAWHEAKSWLVKEIPARYAALGSVLAIENLESGVALVLDRKAEYSVHAPTLAAGLWQALAEALRKSLYHGRKWGGYTGCDGMNGLLFLVEVNQTQEVLRLSIGLSPLGLEVLDALRRGSPTPTPGLCGALLAQAQQHHWDIQVEDAWRSSIEGFKRYFAPRLRLKPLTPPRSSNAPTRRPENPPAAIY